MKIVHAADLHLDSPLRGLPVYPGAPVAEIRSATRRALANLVELCADEGAALLLIAGDLYDGDWRDYATGLYFLEQMGRLRQAGVRVVWIRGNHDAASQITRHLQAPDNVRELSTHQPETVVFEDLGVAVHGVGYATRAVTENLATAYPAPIAGLLNVGLLHTALEGRAGHEPYAPCSVDQLRARGYDYWALGHVHAREVIAERPWIVFPGNLQGRHVREPGPKGASVVQVEGGQVQSVEHRTLDVVRWAQCGVDVSEALDWDDALQAASLALQRALADADGRVLACRVRFYGRSAAHGALFKDPEKLLNQLRALGLELGGVYLERAEVATEPHFDPEELALREDAVGDLLRNIASLASDDEGRADVTREVLAGLDGVPQELLDGVCDPIELLAQARRLLAAHLLTSGEESSSERASGRTSSDATGASA